MNLDNYFARYLGKSSKSVPKADLGEVVNPTHLMSADHGAVASSVVQNVSPIDEEGAASQQADNYPTETTKTFTVLSNDGDEVRQLRMDPLMDVGRPPQRRRIEMSSEEDELDLLLGSTQATEVKQQKPQHGAASLPTSATTELPRLDGVSCTIASLNWSTRSSSMLDDLARLFQKQFEYQLQESDEVLAVFEPFFRDRQLARIAASGPTEPVFREEEPVIDATNIGSLSGCVLRDYQVEGVRFLHRNFVHGTSCILADDMGLGKTAQLASFLMVLKNVHGIEGPHLIVSPLSTLTSWTRELARWAPGLRVLKYYGERSSRKQSRHAKHNRHAVVVTTPAVLNQDRGFFRHRTWVTVLVDEAHVLKGNDTRITMTARKLKACMRIAITGTPVHNRVQEVWSLMSYLYPTLTAQFDRSYVEDAVGAAEDCARLLQRIMLRRTKESLELGIPPRVDEPLTLLEPTYVQQQLLTRLTSQALETHSSSGQLQGHLTHQRCVCNHPLSLRLLATDDRQGSITERLSASGIHLTEDEIIAPSAKMVHLDQLLKQLQVEGHRCLIFSNFTSTLDLLEGLCLLRGFRYERLDGTCNRVERELSMLRFNAPNSTCFIFLATTTAGGVGVTLTGADTVILFDAHFNPQLDRQAADRAHRLGQTREVRVFRLCLHNTIEEHIRDIAEKKASLGAFIVDGGRCQGTQLSADDIREILEQMEAHQEARRHLPVAEGALEEIVSASQAVLHAEDDALVERLVEVNVKGSGVKKGANERGRMEVGSNNNCFVCGGIMHAMEPLYRCVVCPKSYHAKCIGEKVLGEGKTPNRQWSCPRHVCTTCGKAQGVDGAIFLCVGCPRSYCFECLDPRYLQLHEDGSGFLHLTKTYSDMEHERMGERRSLYYMTCLYCCGILSSSESDGDEEEEESSDEENKSVESISD